MPSIDVPDPPLGDELVQLRLWEAGDVGVRLRAGSDAEIIKFTSVPERPSDGEAAAWIERSRHQFAEGTAAYFAVECRRDHVTAGSMGLIKINWQEAKAEVGYWVLPEHRGRGLTGRALRLLSDWALGTVGLVRLELLTNLDNIGSQQVALRCGYHFEGTLRSYSIGRFGRETLHMYSRIAADR